MTSNDDSGNSSWEHARAYANLLGTVPSSFTTSIRQLKADSDKCGALSRPTMFQANRLCHSPSLSASLLSAAKIYFPEKQITEDTQLVTQLPPESLAGLLGTAFMYCRAKKLANEEEWAQYAKIIPNRIEIGGIVGKTIPRIGVTKGILSAIFDTIALTAFHLHDKKGFTEYRRFLKNKSKREDLTYELDRWGCTRYNVASILIQGLGFGVDFSNAYAIGMLASDAEEKSLSGEAYCFRITRVWIDSLELTGSEPDRAMRVEYYPEAPDLATLRSHSTRVKESPGTSCWLDKTKKDMENIEEHLEGEG
jgi:hypothetical protein